MEIKRRIEVVQWFEVKGLEKEPELAAVKRMGVVGEDGVQPFEPVVYKGIDSMGGGGSCWEESRTG